MSSACGRVGGFECSLFLARLNFEYFLSSNCSDPNMLLVLSRTATVARLRIATPLLSGLHVRPSLKPKLPRRGFLLFTLRGIANLKVVKVTWMRLQCCSVGPKATSRRRAWTHEVATPYGTHEILYEQ